MSTGGTPPEGPCGGCGSIQGGPGRGPGGINGMRVHGSWAEMLESTLPSGWNKNILEIVLDKDQRGGFVVSDIDCAKVMRKIGIDAGMQVEGVQICPGGKGVTLVTLKPGVAADSFC